MKAHRGPAVSTHRSGCCLDDTGLMLHAVCSGTFTRRPPRSSPETRTCHCPCHTDGTELAARVLPYRQHRMQLANRRSAEGVA